MFELIDSPNVEIIGSTTSGKRAFWTTLAGTRISIASPTRRVSSELRSPAASIEMAFERPTRPCSLENERPAADAARSSWLSTRTRTTISPAGL
jgi:hypothetical protein